MATRLRLAVDTGDVAHTFCYVLGNTRESTLRLLRNGQVSFDNKIPHVSWAYTWDSAVGNAHINC